MFPMLGLNPAMEKVKEEKSTRGLAFFIMGNILVILGKSGRGKFMFFWKNAKKEKRGSKNLDRLSNSLKTNLHWFKEDIFANDDTIVYRHFKTKGPNPRSCVLIYAAQMVKHEYLSDYVVRPIMASSVPKHLSGEQLVSYFSEQVIHSDGVNFARRYAKLAEKILSGSGVILFDDCPVGIVIHAQGYETRPVEEPPSEAVVRGPRQGFAEDLGVNISLIRRRILNPKFKTRFITVGAQSQTKVAILYVDGIVSQALVEEVQDRIEQIEIDAILDSGYVQEYIQDSPYVPLPTIGQTERPDIVAAKILEGRVAVLVDGSPFALTMPYLLVEAFQANEDYYSHWIPGSFHRFLRYLSFFITTSTPAIYLALVSYHPHLIPTNLVISAAAARKGTPFPGIVEVVAMGLVFEILREGGLRLPQPVGQAISIVGAIVLGDAAVTANLVSAPMIVIVGITAISGFVIYTLYDSAVLLRLILVFAASVLGLYGYMLGFMAFVLLLASMKSFGVPYLSTMTSFAPQDFKDTVIRFPWWRMAKRPRYLAEKDRKRLKSEIKE